MTAPKPPSHLSPATKKWFRSVAAEFELADHHVRLLVLACETWDRGEQARVALLEHGTVFNDRFGQPRARPEVKIENDCRIIFARLTRELDLDGADPPGTPRPPALPSNRG
jgi:phage terminase small subunit